MDRKLLRLKITSYGIRLLYIFSLVFYGLNLLFVTALLFFANWIDDLDTGFYIPAIAEVYQFLFLNIAVLTVLIMIIVGIILFMRARMGGAYLFFGGNILLITYFILRPEPDWYTSSIILVICLLYLIPAKLIGTHSKLISQKAPKSETTDSKVSEI